MSKSWTAASRALLGNAWLERLASGFRWTEGPVWMGDWNCVLFQDLPANRTMRWSDGLFGSKGVAKSFVRHLTTRTGRRATATDA